MRPTLCIRPYSAADEQQVIDLWFQCHLISPSNNPQKDIARKLTVNPELFFVGVLDEGIVATCMAGYEGHRGWINYLAVKPEYQHQGIARQMMEAAEQALRGRGCPKINLQVRSTNTAVLAVYEKLGFTKDDVVSMGKRLVLDREPSPYNPRIR
ncbi:GNAT family acetyltransferase [candidate division KSB3 bacterium]|uniref:GNAT family acetyltransferase n=1 Tax=candidate division KSB3 bacterium TaxID=2044937 RepID=A0A2G6KD58_9BACT|nr:MAG: GNAT family acetyltransferase [candidate division KSB3 bacterium]